jgi:hypothetical protein
MTLPVFAYIFIVKKTKTPWPQSASELYRLSDRRLSAKLVPTFADRGVLRGQDIHHTVLLFVEFI